MHDSSFYQLVERTMTALREREILLNMHTCTQQEVRRCEKIAQTSLKLASAGRNNRRGNFPEIQRHVSMSSGDIERFSHEANVTGACR